MALILFMEPITVSRAITKIERSIKIASLIMIGGYCLSLFIVIKLNISFHWSFVGIFLSITIFLIIRSYLIVKWKIWAFERVDNLGELISRAEDLRIIRSNVIPSKITICSNSDRNKIIEIITNRLDSKTTQVELTDNNIIPSAFKIESSRKHNLIILFACLCILFKPLERLLTKTSTYVENDYALVAILTAVSLFFLFKAITPNQIVTLSNSGVWTKKSSFQKWRAIEDIYIENSIHHDQQRLTQLVIIFNTISGMKNNNLIQKFDIKDLNRTADEIEHALKIFKQRFEKSAHYIPEHNLSQKPDKVSNTNKTQNNTLITFLFPIIIILIGTFMLIRTNRSKEDYYSLQGKINYLEDSIGKHKNKSTRFIKLENNPTFFEIFVGKESGDFSPELDRTDELKINDEVTIYYGSTSTKQLFDSIYLNKSTEFIEKNNQLYFHEKTKSTYLAYFIIGIGSILFIILSIVRIKKPYHR